jgi:hypothetical protein
VCRESRQVIIDSSAAPSRPRKADDLKVHPDQHEGRTTWAILLAANIDRTSGESVPRGVWVSTLSIQVG